jgi:magnesium transporter
MTECSIGLYRQVVDIVRKDVPKLNHNDTIQQALDDIRLRGFRDRIIYFYVVDKNDRLVGVVPTRRLLTSPLDQRISAVMIDRVIAIPQHATVLEAHDYFVRHKLLAFPVVNEHGNILGVVDVEMFTDGVFDLADNKNVDTVRLPAAPEQPHKLSVIGA